MQFEISVGSKCSADDAAKILTPEEPVRFIGDCRDQTPFQAVPLGSPTTFAPLTRRASPFGELPWTADSGIAFALFLTSEIGQQTVVDKMILPDEERDWIEKYRDAMDATAVRESHSSRIRTAWRQIISAVISSSQTIARFARALRVGAQSRLSKPLASAAAGSADQSSVLEQDQIEGLSIIHESEDDAGVSLTGEAEIGSESGFGRLQTN
ncbi:MAG TPA: hypothetical protein VN777_18655 [Terriglobales bacterium]|nr:hypothetical protein [Terriglobales bacterium]